LSPDVNLYNALSCLIAIVEKEPKYEEKVKGNKRYEHLVNSLQTQNDVRDAFLSEDAQSYYAKLHEHEYEEFLEDTSFEMDRIYW